MWTAHWPGGHCADRDTHLPKSRPVKPTLRQKFTQTLLAPAFALLPSSRAPPMPARNRPNALRRDIPPARFFDNSLICLLILNLCSSLSRENCRCYSTPTPVGSAIL